MILVLFLCWVCSIQVSLAMEYCVYMAKFGGNYYMGDIVGLFLGGTVSLAQALYRVQQLYLRPPADATKKRLEYPICLEEAPH